MSKKINKWPIPILSLGILFRLIDIAKPFSGLGKWNEGHYSMTALNYFNYGVFLPVNEYGLDVTTTPIYSWLIHISFRVFGVKEWAARLPSLFFGILSIMLVYYISRRLYNENVANFATFIAAVSPGTVYFSRNIQLESMFTAFSLSAVLFLLIYKDTFNKKWLWASGVSLSIAVLTKYPAVLTYPVLIWIWFKYGERRAGKGEGLRLLTYLLLPLVPSLLWMGYAVSVKVSLTKWYFSKPDAPWTIQSALIALYEAVTRFIPEHFGYIFYYPFVISLPFLIMNWKRHGVIIIYTASWLPLILFFPEFYLNNMYYHYSMLYGMAILLAYFLVDISEETDRAKYLYHRKSAMILFGLIIITFSMSQYNFFFHSYYTDFSRANESEPFYSAKFVALENIGGAPVVADFPMTMFYLGGDPEYINLAYNDQSLIKAVESKNYSYVVTYYLGNRTLKEVLEQNSYKQIAPRAWKKL